MNIVSVPEALDHLGITCSNESMLIEGFISAAQGIVEQEIERDIYQSVEDVPEGNTNVIIFNELTPSKQAALQVATKLLLSSLYLYRESTTDLKLSENPAFKACISGFSGVYVG